jgi:outer membrane protein assembly factor BamB
MRFFKCGSFATMLLLTPLILAQNVTTRSYDNSRSGANPNETILTTANVSGGKFGKLFTVDLDGEAYAQPLYMSKLSIAGGTHNVVFVATMNNSVYALDADEGKVLWSERFGVPIVTSSVQEANHPNINNDSPTGILSTPVIDPYTDTMYFVHGRESTSDGTSVPAFSLEAIDIRTGAKLSGSPVNVTGSYQTADMNAPLYFNAKVQNQRPSLALANGNVYIAFSSHNDMGDYHGWVFAYSASTLDRVATFVDTTIGSAGGIWMAGSGPSVDSEGNIYISSGNGSFGVTPNGLEQTGNSFIKLSKNLELLDYFTPHNSAAMNAIDEDLGASGLLLIPDPNNAAATKYVLGGGKGGMLYLASTTDMGKFNSKKDDIAQEFQAVYGSGTSHVHGTPIYFNAPATGPTVYVWGENDTLREFRFDSATGLLITTPYATSAMTAPVTHANGAMPGGFLCLSANGTSDRILWASTPYNGSAEEANVQGVVYAINPVTLKVLWSDKTDDTRDEIGMFAKDVPPVVANGKLYMINFGKLGTTGAAGQLVVYGLLP